jgi:hypothetical protein
MHTFRRSPRPHPAAHETEKPCYNKALQQVRMRGLEPPPGCPDTDLNRAQRRHMRPPASRSSISSGFADASDASDDMTVVKLLSRGGGGLARLARTAPSGPPGTVAPLMMDSPLRVRVTIRCVRDDLGLPLPPVEVSIVSLEHPLIAEARRLAPSAPWGQKRILAVGPALVYRLRHGRWRGATWIERDQLRFWLCAGARREEGSVEDAYEVFAALHRAGRLLPDDDDRLRDALERNARIIDDAAGSIVSVLADAFDRRGRDVAFRLGALVDARLHVTAPGEEVWVAIATQAADGRFVEERLRDVLFGLVLDAADAELWEPRADWPGGELAWFEVARLGLREPPGRSEATPPTRTTSPSSTPAE